MFLRLPTYINICNPKIFITMVSLNQLERMMKKDQFNALISLVIIIFSFIAISYFIQSNPEYIESLVAETKIKDFAIVFVLIVIIGTVFVPLTFIPLIPVAIFSYGLIATTVFIVIGEFIGALISFLISRRYGIPLVSKLVSLEDIERYERALPEGNLFWAIVLIRIAIPLDALSYILGLFSKIRIQTFAFATLLGLIPSAIALAYLGSLELKYQLIALAMFMAVILIGYGVDSRSRQKNQLKSTKSQ
jgi:uncharacterized membrane protein YdjX (TVP38/TMEM64 family)